MLKVYILMILSCFYYNSYGQNISGIVFTDTTKTVTISNVKIVFNDHTGKKIKKVKTNINGVFIFTAKTLKNIDNIIIEKRGYSSVAISPFSIINEKDRYYLTFVLKKTRSLHDHDYEGSSKLISIENLGQK